MSGTQVKAHRQKTRVYYEDTDFTGVVYHANYLKFCERGRTDMLRALGIEHRELHRSGMAFAVRRVVADFLKPARIDDLLTVRSEVLAVRGARLELGQSVWRGEELLFTAAVTLALIDQAQRPRRMPPALAAVLVPLCVKKAESTDC